MADDKKVITVEIIADAAKFRKQLQSVAAETKAMGGQSSKVQKAGQKAQKEAVKSADVFNKKNKKETKEAVKAEKELQAAVRATTKAVKEKTRAGERLSAQVRREQQQVAKRERELDRLSRNRGGAGRGGRGANREEGGFFGGLGGLRGLASVGAAGVGLFAGLMGSQISDAYARNRQFKASAGALTGMGATMAGVKAAADRGVGLGYGPMDTVAQMRSVGRQTGDVNDVTQAQALARSTGIDIEESSGFMGSLARGGKIGAQAKKELADAVALGQASGLKKGRLGEYFQSVSTLLERQQSVSAGDVSGRGVSQLLTAMGRSGQSGLQGARGGSVLARLDEGIRKPGGGEAGQALMLQALGFGTPGGKTSYYEALKQQQQGVTGKGGVQNVQKLFAETKKQYGGGESQILALQEMTGLSIDQLESMRGVIEGMGKGSKSQADLEAILKSARPIEEQALDETTKMGATLVDMAAQERRLVAMGEGVTPQIEQIRDAINTLIDTMMPAVITMLDVIATAASGIADVMSIGKSRDTTVQASQQSIIAKQVESLRARKDTMDSGEYASQMQALAEKSKKFGGVMHATSGGTGAGGMPLRSDFQSGPKGAVEWQLAKKAWLDNEARRGGRDIGRLDSTQASRLSEEAKAASEVDKRNKLKKLVEQQQLSDPNSVLSQLDKMGGASPALREASINASVDSKLAEFNGKLDAALEGMNRALNEGPAASVRRNPPPPVRVTTTGGPGNR